MFYAFIIKYRPTYITASLPIPYRTKNAKPNWFILQIHPLCFIFQYCQSLTSYDGPPEPMLTMEATFWSKKQFFFFVFVRESPQKSNECHCFILYKWGKTLVLTNTMLIRYEKYCDTLESTVVFFFYKYMRVLS